MMRRHSVKSTSSHAVKGTMAALLTSTSSFPWAPTVSSTMRLTSSSLEMSTVMPLPPAGAASSAPWMSATTTVAPSSASLSAIALPMPCPPPVTIATLSSSLPMSPS